MARDRRTEVLELRVTPREREFIAALAERRGVTVEEFLCRVVAAELERDEQTVAESTLTFPADGSGLAWPIVFDRRES